MPDAANKFYVYIYKDPRPGKNLEPIYVGKGAAKWRRASAHWRCGSHNKFLQRKLTKIRAAGLKPVIELVGEFESELDALTLERDLIRAIGRSDIGSGPLTNLRDGDLELRNWAYPDWLRDQKRNLMSVRYADPAERAATADRSRQMWKDPEYRAKVMSASAAGVRTDAYRAANSERFKRQWRDPAYRARQIANITEIGNRPEVIAVKSEKTALSWRDDRTRMLRSAGIRTAQNTPEWRAAKAKETGAKWQNPEHRAMRCARISAARRKWLWELNGHVYESPEDAGKANGITAAAVRWRVKHGHGRKIARATLPQESQTC